MTHLVSDEERLRSAITPTIEARRPFGPWSKRVKTTSWTKGSARQAEAQNPNQARLGDLGLARSPSDPPTHAEPTTGSAQPRQGASDLARSDPTQNQRPPPSDPEVPAQRRPRICLLLSSRRLRLSPASTANPFLPAHSLKKRIKKASLSSCLALGISRAYSYRLFKAKEGGYGLGEGMGDEDV